VAYLRPVGSAQSPDGHTDEPSIHRRSSSGRNTLLGRSVPGCKSTPVVSLIGINRCDTMSHMKTITIRELHLATGRWVRRASAGEVYVTERGRLVAKIVPASPRPAKPFFADPKFTPAFLANRKHLRGGTDSTQAVSEERNREVL
jgi:antitoxin (DNA-binding transcriptional repressor) of toxin-antitoxin stability system